MLGPSRGDQGGAALGQCPEGVWQFAPCLFWTGHATQHNELVFQPTIASDAPSDAPQRARGPRRHAPQHTPSLSPELYIQAIETTLATQVTTLATHLELITLFAFVDRSQNDASSQRRRSQLGTDIVQSWPRQLRVLLKRVERHAAALEGKGGHVHGCYAGRVRREKRRGNGLEGEAR